MDLTTVMPSIFQTGNSLKVLIQKITIENLKFNFLAGICEIRKKRTDAKLFV